jgi:hypothetical protein
VSVLCYGVHIMLDLMFWWWLWRGAAGKALLAVSCQFFAWLTRWP